MELLDIIGLFFIPMVSILAFVSLLLLAFPCRTNTNDRPNQSSFLLNKTTTGDVCLISSSPRRPVKRIWKRSKRVVVPDRRAFRLWNVTVGVPNSRFGFMCETAGTTPKTVRATDFGHKVCLVCLSWARPLYCTVYLWWKGLFRISIHHVYEHQTVVSSHPLQCGVAFARRHIFTATPSGQSGLARQRR